MRLTPDLLPCPECHQPTDSLNGYRLPTFLLFIFIAASFKHALVVACPTCMRKKLLRLGLINLLPANLLWLVLLLPWYSLAAVMTTRPGHSGAVLKALGR